MKRSLLAISLISLFASCVLDDGLDYDELHVSALRPDGTLATSVPSNGCVTLPMLLGSQIEKTVTIANQIYVDVSATRDRAHVKITGPNGGSEVRTIPAEDLRHQTYSENIPIEGSGGQMFTLQLRSSCPSPDSTAD